MVKCWFGVRKRENLLKLEFLRERRRTGGLFSRWNRFKTSCHLRGGAWLQRTDGLVILGHSLRILRRLRRYVGACDCGTLTMSLPTRYLWRSRHSEGLADGIASFKSTATGHKDCYCSTTRRSVQCDRRPTSPSTSHRGSDVCVERARSRNLNFQMKELSLSPCRQRQL